MSVPFPVFHAPDAMPSAATLRRRVREAIARHRERVARMERDRPDIAALMRDPASGWGEPLRLVRDGLRFYRAVWRAELAHARGERLDRWAIWDAAVPREADAADLKA